MVNIDIAIMITKFDLLILFYRQCLILSLSLECSTHHVFLFCVERYFIKSNFMRYTVWQLLSNISFRHILSMTSNSWCVNNYSNSELTLIILELFCFQVLSNFCPSNNLNWMSVLEFWSGHQKREDLILTNCQLQPSHVMLRLL